MASRRIKIIVAGGGVAGLALANMLELAGIDYVILEKYGDIAPDVGASIGIFPNSCRILDQMGCYDPLEALVEGLAGKDILLRNSQGRKVAMAKDFNTHMTKRFGYKGLWLDRQAFLQILYDNLKDKSKIILNKGVARVDQCSGGVQVTTTDGDILSGNLLVGADGFHSAVRREMWRIADEENPEYFPSRDRTDVPCEYCCIFGISEPPPGFEFAVCDNVMGRNHSYVFATGPEKRVYWFLFQKRPKSTCGLYEKVPRYTSEDTVRLAQKHFQNPISDHLTFKDIWDSRSSATLIAIPELVFSQWHYGNIIAVGDAAHKFNPMIGQGGNCAIETCALLVNNLNRLLQSKAQGQQISDTELTEVFRETQAAQHDRVEYLKKESHDFQSVQANDKLVSRVLAKILSKIADTDLVIGLFTERSKPGPKLDMVDVPIRHRYESYLDERPARPFMSSLPLIVSALSLIGLLTGVVSAKLGESSCYDGPCAVRDVLFTGMNEMKSAIRLSIPFSATDRHSEMLHQSAQSIYLFTILFPLLVNWTIDGYRYSNKQSRVSRYLSATLCHVVGVGLVGPLHCLASIWKTRQDFNSLRAVPQAIARSIVPAVVIGYIIPTLALLSPVLPDSYRLAFATAWPFTPLLVSLLVHSFSKSAQRRDPTLLEDTNPDLAGYSRSDLSDLRRTHAITFCLAFLAHLLYFASLSPSIKSVSSTMGDLLLGKPTDGGTYIGQNRKAVSYDISIELASAILLVLFFCIYWIAELRNRGLITSIKTVAALTIYIAALPLVGPGGAYAGFAWWRESVLAASVRSPENAPALQEKRHNGAIAKKAPRSDCTSSGATLMN